MKRRWILILSLLILALGGSILLVDFTLRWGYNHVQNFGREIEQATQALETIEKSPEQALVEAEDHLKKARSELETLRPVAEPAVSVANLLVGLPWLGRYAKQAVNLWLFAEAGTELGETFLETAQLGLNSLENKGSAGLVESLPALRHHLEAIQIDFAQAQSARNQLEGSPPWLPANLAARLETTLSRWDATAPRLEKTLAEAGRLAEILTVFLEDDQPKTYLLLIQSSDELRATGGFITGAGKLRLEKGRITELTVTEVQLAEQKFKWSAAEGYLEQPISPPPPMMEYMGLGHWILRDANWWANFPATARQAVELWNESPDTPVDGVIAITDEAMELLLRVTGPVQVANGQIVDDKNLKVVIAQEIYEGEDLAGGDQDRQTAVFSELGQAILSLTEKLPPDRLFQLAEYLPLIFRRGDILIASFDPEKALILHELGVDGSLQGKTDDYFYLVEHNISYNKLSPFISQDMSYEVVLGTDAWPISASLTVDEANRYSPAAEVPGYPKGYYDGGRWNRLTRQVNRWRGYYGGYTRLYLPAGSQPLYISGLEDSPQVGRENGRTVIGGYVGLMPDHHRQLQFRWIPPNQASSTDQYRLRVQHQPGAPDHSLRVIVHLPPGFEATDITPTPTHSQTDAVSWQTVLNQDTTFSLRLEGEALVMNTPTVPVEAAAASVAPTSTPRPTPRPVAPAPPAPPGRMPQPVWLSIPAIGVGAPIIPVGLEEPGGIMDSPPEADLVGWYELGPRPGEASNAVLSGHINWQGEIGVFNRLHELKPGDTIEVQSGPESGFRYVVDSMAVYQAETAPVAEIFGATTEPILTLITCVGPYNEQRQEYRDRLVVRAKAE